MKFRLSMISCAAAALAAGGCSPKSIASKAETAVVLAKVGSTEILPAQLITEAARRMTSGQPLPEKAVLLNEMAGEEAFVQRAMALGLDRDPEVRRAWRSLLIGTLKSRELDQRVRDAVVRPEEIQAAYDTEKAAFAQPARARAGIVFVSKPLAIPEAAAAELRKRIDDAKALATSGPEGFQQAALNYSEHQASRYKGGDIGWVQPGRAPHRIPMQVVDAVLKMPAVGTVSDVLVAEDGYYIATQLEQKPASVLPLQEVEGKLRARLLRERRDSIVRDFDQSTRQLAKTELFPEALNHVSLPAAATPESTPPSLPRTAGN